MNQRYSDEVFQGRYTTAASDAIPLTSEDLCDLCLVCDRIFQRFVASYIDLESKVRYGSMRVDCEQFQPDVSVLEDVAQARCPLCRLLFEGWSLRHSNLDLIPEGKTCRFGYYLTKPRGDPSGDARATHLFLECVDEHGIVLGTTWYQIAYEVGPGRDLARESWGFAVPTEAPLGLASSWVHDLCARHEICRSSESSKLPTRLIEIGSADATTLRLVETTESDRWPYVALSHRWGHGLPWSRLTTGKYAQYLLSIPYASVERTFRDAVQVAQSLGHRYLWVDTLCIIQDSEEDWQKECIRMEEVYANAELVIAASAALDESAGFLSRLSGGASMCEIPVPAADAITLCFRIRVSPPVQMTDQQMSLLFRAWPLQEKLLARRYLAFGSYQMSFQCLEDTYYESIHAPFESDVVQTDHPSLRAGLSTVDNTSDKALLKRFYDIVMFYSTLNLSRADDRLPALSGIVRRFGKHLGSDYFAGLWSYELALGLAWNVVKHGPSPTCRFGSTSSPPTWSWASSMSSVEWRADLLETDYINFRADVIDVNTEPVGLDPLGKIKGGQVIIDTLVSSLDVMSYNEASGTFAVHLLGDHELEFIPDSRSQFDVGESITLQGVLLCSHVVDSFFCVYMLALEPCGSLFKRVGLITGYLQLRNDFDGYFGEIRRAYII